jgi:hypothetical protein|tara:strand:- start:5209 stop:5442 length:234 start_codon:yes stop_codon:yes gene_type:complete
MAIPQIDLKLVWLDEAYMASNSVIDTLQEKEEAGRLITKSDAEFAKICGAYLYLFKLAKESRLLEQEDILNKTETIH